MMSLSSLDIRITPASVESAREAAARGQEAAHRFLSDPSNRVTVESALRIRAVENGLYELFGKGKLHGTIHTCIGQEFTGAILGRSLRSGDFVTSNHRCHGHFIGATQNWRGLIDELIGNEDGVCAGIGSSQHLWAKNFISNGQQGGLLPVAAGVALDRKMKTTSNVVVSFIGEGTLGEGVLYETLNLDALWELPHVIVCENNFYSQSTPQIHAMAGSIAERARGFSMAVEEADTWDLPELERVFRAAIERARKESRPTFMVVKTYRLNPHSKGDDNRDRKEIEWFREHDATTLAVRDYPEYERLYRHYVSEVASTAELALAKIPLEPQSYFLDQLPRVNPGALQWQAVVADGQEERRTAQQLNAFYQGWLTRDTSAVFLGEDIADPYGGAFKISKDLTSMFPDRVRTTPISEAAIIGTAIGLAISGRRALVEIMFGDFITYGFDQIVNNASKMFHMYNKRLECPVVVRTPMGARRGYGPTHSQSLERFLIGIDNCCTFSLSSIAPAALQLAGLETLRCPVLLLENKADYTLRTFEPPVGFRLAQDGAPLVTFRIRPAHAKPTVTLLAYGGIARFVADRLLEIFERTDAVPEMIVPTCISPLNLAPIADAVRESGNLVVIEEGAGYGSVGAEAIAQLHEVATFRVRRVSGKAAPIPSAPTLEAAALPSIDDVCAAITALMEPTP